uniref:Granulins domain-containing protein n=1 Tax=Triticum urartu TaxID=4572 RepID=A0A8R7PKZ0_TRIUA
PTPEPTVCDDNYSCPEGGTTCCCIYRQGNECFTWTCCCIYRQGDECFTWTSCPLQGTTCCDDNYSCCPHDYGFCDTNLGTCLMVTYRS